MNTDKDSNNEFNEFADWLQLGSRNIDRMANELNQLTRMLIGTIFLSAAPRQGRLTFVNNARTVMWVVTFREDCISRGTIAITGHTVFDSGSSVTFSSAYPESCIRKEVQRVYEARGVLIKGLLGEFPFLTQNLAHFIEASKVKFPD